MRYFASYVYSDDDGGGGGAIGLYARRETAIHEAWRWLCESVADYGPPRGGDFLRADVYAYDGDSHDPDDIWETLPPLYTSDDGDVLHICADARGARYTTTREE